MLAPSIHPLLWLFGCVLFRGTTTSTDSSVHAVTGQSQSTTHGPEVKDHTSESSVKSTPPTHLNLPSVGQTTTAKSSSIAATLLALTVQDEKSSGSRSTAASPLQGQEPKRSENTTASATQGTSKPVTPTPKPSDYLPVPTPTDDKSPLTVAAFGKVLCNLGRGRGSVLPDHTGLDTQPQRCFPGDGSTVFFFSMPDPGVFRVQGKTLEKKTHHQQAIKHLIDTPSHAQYTRDRQFESPSWLHLSLGSCSQHQCLPQLHVRTRPGHK
ncbi:endothelial cell-specific chemotaxis regulator isoform X1 [Aquila chrysaetos chrysaetos]|uniref:endothelial cell-specific chemotaxis regulator isoform X1 n=1 Tax=Aquila chrysaetos chrysaetos TaxID=223781 RepID=UPI0011771691|nr:endothelial cell-specific chemotaxis regulator isoform X1 [Aquila chrysaetos chrysaetos]